MAKFALLIVTTIPSDPGLAQYPAPGKDAEEFRDILESKDGAAFDGVRVLLNEPVATVREALEGFFAERKTDDLLLLYFAGHILRDEDGELYLALKDSDRSRLASTGLRSDFIREAMNHSRSRRQVLILDCCNSIILGRSATTKTAGSMGIQYAFEGSDYGRVVLVASDAVQFIWKGAKAEGKPVSSRFTHFLADGLKNGVGEAVITINALFQYAQTFSGGPKQTPQIWYHSQEGKMILRQGVGPGRAQPVPAPAAAAGISKRLFATVRQLRASVRRHTLLTLFLSVLGVFLLGLLVYGPPASTLDRPAQASFAGRVQIYWFVGLGNGTAPAQMDAEKQVVQDFNASQDQIELVLQVLPNAGTYDLVVAQFSTESGADIYGPMDWGTFDSFHRQWLDLGPYLKTSGFDSSVFNPALLNFYRYDEGQLALPFALYPEVLYYNPGMFDEAGLAYPPQNYGEKYKLPDGREVDWNWETFTRLARQLTLDINGRNASEPGFDRTHIAQVGYSLQDQGPNAMASLYAGPSDIFTGASKGDYKSAIPADWKSAFKWYYDAIWGEQPFMANRALANSGEFGNGNLFPVGKAAMAPGRTPFACCPADLARTGQAFQIAVLPISTDGRVHGLVASETFHIWRGSQHPQEAFRVLLYLVTRAGDKLLPVYGGLSPFPPGNESIPPQNSGNSSSLTAQSRNILAQVLAQPDGPGTEPRLPNWSEAYEREKAFMYTMAISYPEAFNFETEFARLQQELTAIYNK